MAIFPRLQSADTTFKSEGQYSCKLLLKGKEAAALKKFIDGEMAASFAAAKNGLTPAKAKAVKKADPPYRDPDPDEGEGNTGLVFSFTMTASGTNPKTGEDWTRSPRLFDSHNNPYTGNTLVGKGSIIAIAYKPSQYYVPTNGAGVTLYLQAVQIKTMVPYTGPDGSSYGFGASEDEDDFSTDDDNVGGGDGEGNGEGDPHDADLPF